MGILTLRRIQGLVVVVATALMLTACGGSNHGSGSAAASTGSDLPPPPASATSSPTPGGANVGRTFTIEPGPDATTQALRAFVQAEPKDTIQFDCGYFDLHKTMLLTHTENILIEGCGKDKTVLSFRNSDGAEGILVDNANGVIVKNLTVADTDGDAFVLRNVDHGTLDGVRAFWSSGGGGQSADPISAKNYQDGRLHVACTQPAVRDPNAPENKLLGGTRSPDYTVSPKSGRYGMYPVKSSNILITDSESIGASDAGIYVGQDNTTIIKNSRAAYNVFGFEIENVRRGEYKDNLAECNTGGFLVYNLDNLTQYGELTTMHDNISRMNNTYNFTSGGFVSNLPPGSGMVTLGYEGIDVFNNSFIDNNTAGIIHTSYQIFPEGAGRPSDKKLDFYTEGLHIHNNTFKNNGHGIPTPTTTDIQQMDITHLLPLALGLKVEVGCLTNPAACPALTDGSVLHGADIVWDGYTDTYNPNCPYPTGADGKPVKTDTYYAGKPVYTGEDPQPACYYNAYKYNTSQTGAPLKVPTFYPSCIDHNNFGTTDVAFANFHGTEGLNLVISLLGSNPLADLTDPTKLLGDVSSVQNFAATFDLAAHDCQTRFGKNLPPIAEVVIPPFVPSGNYSTGASQEQIDALCNAATPVGEVNFTAAASVDCPRLDQYHLFASATDPTSQPNGERSFPYVLNTKLFSDYAVKYRVAYLPPGTTMTYNAPGADQPTGTLIFPTGTIIAKTFSFANNGTVTPAETRLLIKRKNDNGDTRWKGLPYVWTTDAQGKPVAVLTPEGATLTESWDYQDINTGARLQGSTSGYSVPSENDCLTCHANRNRPGGSAPIGPKARNMNRGYQSEVVGDTSSQARDAIFGHNQLVYLCRKGWMTHCPSDLNVDANTLIATALPRVPRFDVPGDSGFAAGSDKDVEARVRSFLEVNCQHCHNPQGFASNTGLFLDVFRPVDGHYGICKTPTSAGAKGTGGRMVDIQPADANASVLAFRIGPDATSPAARMPPIARSVPDKAAYTLVDDWINNVVTGNYAGASACVKP